jgi:F420-non-reducing hydrogenase iron-sulfur subunit
MSEFQPRIVVFACNWCSYAGADLAGVSRMQYPPTTRVIRVMCSGRVTPGFILEAFRLGADGVLVTGCHPGDCHYITGNENAVATVEKTSRLLTLLGIEPKRLRLQWISAAEGARFARIMTEFTEEIGELGPRPREDARLDELAVPEAIRAG